MVANVGEILDAEDEEDGDKDGSGFNVKKVPGAEKKEKQKALVIKTTGRHTVYLPVPGMVEAEDLKPGELIAVNKESFIVYEKLPAEYDSRVMAMEVDERPTEDYTDIGGLDKQIEELTEAIVLPMTHKERFINIGIRPPKGLLMHGPPGTGKTLMARACAAQTKATFLKLAGPQLVQMYIGDGAKMIRDAFDLAREKAPAIIFIDELDAIGTKRGSGEGETREVHRTMLELLNQLDGFSQHDDIKVIAATNRPDILDPALLRSGRLDRKVELPPPNEEARVRILKIHSKKMNVNHDDVNFEELARSS
jgi:26S proteasome regulatory subunit T5